MTQAERKLFAEANPGMLAVSIAEMRAIEAAVKQIPLWQNAAKKTLGADTPETLYSAIIRLQASYRAVFIELDLLKSDPRVQPFLPNNS